MLLFCKIVLLAVLYLTKAEAVAGAKAQSFPCVSPLKCVPLKECKSLMAAIKASQNSQTLLKFLKSQICGDHSQERPKVCCPDDILGHKSPEEQLNGSPCKSSFECVDLPKCGPLMYLLGLEKPLTTGTAKFIRSRQCGAGSTHPKVCCKVTKDTVTITTVSTSTASLKEKAKTLNTFFNSNYFDSVMFDFFVR